MWGTARHRVYGIGSIMLSSTIVELENSEKKLSAGRLYVMTGVPAVYFKEHSTQDMADREAPAATVHYSCAICIHRTKSKCQVQRWHHGSGYSTSEL